MRKNEPEDMGGCEAEQPAGWYCTRDFHHNGPCALKRLPAAPSVEQDEREAFEAWAKDRYARTRWRTGEYKNVATQAAWEAWQACAASTSANVAQGAEAQSGEPVAADAMEVAWQLRMMGVVATQAGDRLIRAAQIIEAYATAPARTALTDEQIADIRRAAVLIRENSYPFPDKPRSNWALADRIDKIISGDKT